MSPALLLWLLVSLAPPTQGGQWLPRAPRVEQPLARQVQWTRRIPASPHFNIYKNLGLLARLLYGQREGLQDMMNTKAGWMEPAPAGDKFHPWAG